jgi:hypothetical protein
MREGLGFYEGVEVCYCLSESYIAVTNVTSVTRRGQIPLLSELTVCLASEDDELIDTPTPGH